MNFGKSRTDRDDVRSDSRIQSLRKISFNYEGRSEDLEVRPPDVSCRGMFIATNQEFPEGAVLKLMFHLTLTGAEIHARGEVRYCLKGVGVGVEFVELAPEAAKKIEHETELWSQKSSWKNSTTGK